MDMKNRVLPLGGWGFFFMSRNLIVIAQSWFISTVFADSLWLFAVSYYIYITFIGYRCKRTTLFFPRSQFSPPVSPKNRILSFPTCVSVCLLWARPSYAMEL
jgi:hypothetical protein